MRNGTFLRPIPNNPAGIDIKILNLYLTKSKSYDRLSIKKLIKERENIYTYVELYNTYID